jgi:hypothetical protein
VGDDLKIQIITPFEAVFSDGSRVQVAALVKDFGAAQGMLIDADYGVLKPHVALLLESGYGYSSNLGHHPSGYTRTTMIAILQDWGWSGSDNQKPDWLGS